MYILIVTDGENDLIIFQTEADEYEVHDDMQSGAKSGYEYEIAASTTTSAPTTPTTTTTEAEVEEATYPGEEYEYEEEDYDREPSSVETNETYDSPEEEEESDGEDSYDDYDDEEEESDADQEEELLYRNYEILSDFYKKHFVDLRVLDTTCDPASVHFWPS